ncbi:MAG: hypothetical protein D6815_06025, partial [Candidatus Dadabacteria bacterium]
MRRSFLRRIFLRAAAAVAVVLALGLLGWWTLPVWIAKAPVRRVVLRVASHVTGYRIQAAGLAMPGRGRLALSGLAAVGPDGSKLFCRRATVTASLDGLAARRLDRLETESCRVELGAGGAQRARLPRRVRMPVLWAELRDLHVAWRRAGEGEYELKIARASLEPGPRGAKVLSAAGELWDNRFTASARLAPGGEHLSGRLVLGRISWKGLERAFPRAASRLSEIAAVTQHASANARFEAALPDNLNVRLDLHVTPSSRAPAAGFHALVEVAGFGLPARAKVKLENLRLVGTGGQGEAELVEAAAAVRRGPGGAFEVELTEVRAKGIAGHSRDFVRVLEQADAGGPAMLHFDPATGGFILTARTRLSAGELLWDRWYVSFAEHPLDLALKLSSRAAQVGADRELAPFETRLELAAAGLGRASFEGTVQVAPLALRGHFRASLDSLGQAYRLAVAEPLGDVYPRLSGLTVGGRLRLDARVALGARRQWSASGLLEVEQGRLASSDGRWGVGGLRLELPIALGPA